MPRMSSPPLTSSAIQEEFDYLSVWSKSMYKTMAFFKDDRTKHKNRYHDIPVVESTRVKLQNRVNNTDYIHANYINLSNEDFILKQNTQQDTACSSFHPTERSQYISCQAPTPSTFEDFWQMVWQDNCGVIVMLTDFEENGKTKANKYWPELPGHMHQFSNGFAVCLEHSVESNGIRLSNFKLIGHSVCGVVIEREIIHIQYLNWKDHDTPSVEGVLRLCKLLWFSKQTSQKRGRTGPIVVHCSAGIGRSGTMIAIDYCLKEFSMKKIPLTRSKVLHTCMQLRLQRLGMIQTETQYEFLYKFLSRINALEH